MPSKTKINGTSYDVSKGRALSGGTGYDIQSGRTLVDGVGYDILHGYRFTIEGSYYDSHQIYLNDVAISAPSVRTITEDDVIKIKGFAESGASGASAKYTFFDGQAISKHGTRENSYSSTYYLRVRAHSDLTFTLERKYDQYMGAQVTNIYVTGEYSII